LRVGGSPAIPPTAGKTTICALPALSEQFGVKPAAFQAELINPWHADGMLPSLLRGTVALERFIEDRFAVMLRYLIILNTRLI